MSENNQKRRLTDLVENPRETLDVELKDWLDLRGSQEHKAQLAKALLALANHGGGYLLIGFEEIIKFYKDSGFNALKEGIRLESLFKLSRRNGQRKKNG